MVPNMGSCEDYNLLGIDTQVCYQTKEGHLLALIQSQ